MAAPKKTDDKRINPAFAAQAGKGRPKGVPNKATTAVKEMILAALAEAGGIDYLVKQSESNPTAFLTLVGKVLPLQVTGEDGGPIKYADVTQDAEVVDKLMAGLSDRSESMPTLQ